MFNIPESGRIKNKIEGVSLITLPCHHFSTEYNNVRFAATSDEKFVILICCSSKPLRHTSNRYVSEVSLEQQIRIVNCWNPTIHLTSVKASSNPEGYMKRIQIETHLD